jgi:hypothetical protein
LNPHSPPFIEMIQLKFIYCTNNVKRSVIGNVGREMLKDP